MKTKVRTFTLRAQPHQRQDKDRVKRTVDVVADHVVSLHDNPDGMSGTDIALDTGGILRVEEDRMILRIWLEND